MKRILFVSMVSLAFVACNNEADTTTTTDSTTMYDNTGVGTTDTGMMVDTSMMRDTMNRDPL